MGETRWSRAWEAAKPEKQWKRKGSESLIGAVLGEIFGQSNGWKIGLLAGGIGAVGGAVLPIAWVYLVSLLRDGRKQAEFESDRLKGELAQQSAALTEKDMIIATKTREIETLHKENEDQEVSKVHFDSLKSILEHTKTYVIRGQDVAFKTAYDVEGIRGHFPEIAPVLEEWELIARTTAAIERALDERYKSEIAAQGFNSPDFNYAAFDYLLGNVKLVAGAQKLDDDRAIEWRNFDPGAPDLYLWKGT
ncbi:MAG TPA: hypothetical protein VG246_04135, partial [Acidimicrobiales bacterium]|nr:hypothetical protein [Acidimicrobiales bacterium]